MRSCRISNLFNVKLHGLMRLYLGHRYSQKLRMVERLHPDLCAHPDRAYEKEFKDYWRDLWPSVNPRWATLYANLSGVKDVRFVPEDVFYGVVERCLNNCNAAGHAVEDKCDMNFYVPEQYRPRIVVAFVRGVFFNDKGLAISREKAESLIRQYASDVICKPSMGTSGGAGVYLFENGENNDKICGDVRLTVDWIAEYFEGCVVQEVVRQEPVAHSFNPGSLNTCRLITFRRPWSGEVSVIAGMLRMGNGNSVIDNVTRGGVCVDIGKKGNLAEFGLDYRFAKVNDHPITHLPFRDVQLPYYDEMCRVVADVARRVPAFNLLGFDVVARENGKVCIIEINATSISLKPQTRRPLFGEETEQVKDWCLVHQKYDTFKHFRTWY